MNSAIVTSNRLRGGTRIVNESEGDVQIGFNTPAPGANSELDVIQTRSFEKSSQNLN